MNSAIILLSGGLDSATVLFLAKAKGFKTYALIFDYGQRHRKEILRAKKLAQLSGSESRVVKISLPWAGSALLDKKMRLPQNRKIIPREIPATYVPARNIIFLSLAASYAEVVGARAIFIGANAIDYSGYPDCRPAFFKAYQKVMHKGMKAGVEGKTIKIFAPLLYKTKEQIIRLGLKLKVPYELTWSCYAGGARPCGKCDSCLLREKGFEQVRKVTKSLGHQ
ncbi:MAG: 7-cyano-7-deazaguanine synthase QueC [Omnitrophica WOR_2 bacterium RIFCSPHIGHO2_01_FULL_48_9]|nr:MAG: 7-cyano-7-deazaguanine synthase QueC [Omnitrophica WOR_2 bacterium RIFCSPHIGHO2_02_FULL_48_11]OGX33163.1 MAG: 7-cyano-7-deazaguanine synthase QueC [Omnitrophica WOR_2 bacterium RIFCSPHIGHO2_01_FULL_48_9]